MNEGKYVFALIASYIPRFQFDKIVAKYRGNYHVHELTCYNQFLHLLFGQITPCNSLRDICLCLEAHKSILYHLGFGKTVDSSSLSRANERRDYHIYEEFGNYLIKLVRPYYRNTKLSDVDLENAIFALDSTTISTSIKLATWALGKYGKGAVKMHTLIDLRGSIPMLIHITDGRWHDSNMLDLLEVDVNAIYTADKAYVDFPAMWTINLAGAYFVLRPKDNMQYVLVEQLSDGSRGSSICGDYIIRLTGYYAKHAYPADMRLVRALDPESGEIIDFISALDIANIYRHRWDIELFFKWIKQNIVVKTLWGYSENAVKTHLWSAICAYLLMALIKAKTGSKYTITEVATLLSVSIFEKMDLEQLLTHPSDRLVSLLSNQNVKEQNYTNGNYLYFFNLPYFKGIIENDFMKTCKHCGAHNIDDACYCFNCGKKIDVIVIEPPQPNYLFRLTIDDTFDIKGRGPVVTGIIEMGNIQNGDSLTITGNGKILNATCAGIEHNRKLVGCAKSGDSVGILLNGVKFEDVHRGQLVTK